MVAIDVREHSNTGADDDKHIIGHLPQEFLCHQSLFHFFRPVLFTPEQPLAKFIYHLFSCINMFGRLDNQSKYSTDLHD